MSGRGCCPAAAQSLRAAGPSAGPCSPTHAVSGPREGVCSCHSLTLIPCGGRSHGLAPGPYPGRCHSLSSDAPASAPSPGSSQPALSRGTVPDPSEGGPGFTPAPPPPVALLGGEAPVLHSHGLLWLKLPLSRGANSRLCRGARLRLDPPRAPATQDCEPGPSWWPLPPSDPQAAARPSAPTWDWPLDTLAGPPPAKGRPLPSPFPSPAPRVSRAGGCKCRARSPAPKPGPRKTPSPPGRTVCSGPPTALLPLWSSVPPAQVRARQRAARRASGSPMVARRTAGQSAQGRGRALYTLQSRQRAGRAGGRGTGGAPPGSSGKQLWGLRGPAGEILTQVIWSLSFIALVEPAVPGMRHRLPDSSTHQRRTSIPPAAGPAWGQGSCRKLVPAASTLPPSPPHLSRTPGTARSSGGLPRGPDSPLCGAGAPSLLGACQRSSGPQPTPQGPCPPRTLLPEAGHAWGAGGPGGPQLQHSSFLEPASSVRARLQPTL